MDYNERLPDNEKIKNSLEKYVNAFHAKINALGHLNPDILDELSNRGFRFQLENDIEELIDDFVNIYGYIYKNSPVDPRGYFERGTNESEIKLYEKEGEIKTFLSTTNDKEIAKRFISPNKGVLIRINNKNVPYVYLEGLKDRGSDSEEEFLILPFSKVKKIQYHNKEGNTDYYSIEIERIQLTEIEDKELAELKKEVVSEFAQFGELVETYLAAKNDLEFYDNRRQNEKESYEEYKYYANKCEEFYNEYNNNKEKINRIRDKFIRMLKGLCRQRENDIDSQLKDEKKESDEKKRKEVERKKIQLKEQIERNITSLKENIKTITEKYNNLSQTLGIEISISKSNFIKIIKDKSDLLLKLLEENANDESEEALKRYDGLNKSTSCFNDLLMRLENQIFLEVKEKLNERVKAIIDSSISSKFYEWINNVKEQPDSLIHRIFGKNQLKEARENNLKARLERELLQNRNSNPDNSVRIMLEEMYKCAAKYYNGVLPQSMQQIETLIRQNFNLSGNPFPSTSQMMANALKRIQMENTFPEIPRKRPRFFRWFYEKKEIERLNINTSEIHTSIQLWKKRSTIESRVESVPNIYQQIINELEKTYKEIQLQKNSGTLGITIEVIFGEHSEKGN